MPKPEQDNNDTSMRDDFEQAIDDLTPLESDSTLDDDNPAPATDDDNPAPATDDDPAPAADDDPAPAADDDPAPAADDDPAPSKDSIKAPLGWSPTSRSYWSKLPRDVQEQVAAREKEMAAAMADTKTARVTHETFTQMANSFAPVLAVEGVDAMTATKSLFNTAAQLRMGNQETKAKVIAELIQNYDVDVETLDSTLMGQHTPANPENDQMAKMFNERFGPMLSHMQAQQEQQSVTAQTAADAEVTNFAEAAEFLSDVRLDMADLIDMAQARGKKLPLQQAYDIACQANPEIKGILDERAKEAALIAGQSSIAAKKAAASSLSGRKTGITQKNTEGMSLRDSLNEAMENTGKA